MDVKTRLQRRTTYDLAVTIQDNTHHRILLESSKTRSEAGSTNSSTATALISNTTKTNRLDTDGYESSAASKMVVETSRLSYDEVAENIPSPDDPQPGIMSTLMGGAMLGGLLTRRQKQETIMPSMQTILESPAALTSSEMVGLAEEDQPFHRVVMAPAGRIGVTFVEYRGHCMVSDVYADSPLMGWIFPSDVLIAIDELPVSGMRVREIIKVLKDRTERQRALRVISSHAMNEFTLNTGDETS